MKWCSFSMAKPRKPNAFRFKFAWLLLLLMTACRSAPAVNPYAYSYSNLSGPSPDAAIEFYTERVNRTSQGFLDRASLASAYVSKAQWTGDPSYFEPAEKWARESQKEMPNPGALVVLAQVAEANHRFAEAVELCERARQMDRTQLDVVSLLITSHIELGRSDLAAEYLEALYEVNAATVGLHARVAEARGDFPRACELYQKAISLEQPQQRALSARLRTQLGRCLMRSGRLEQAESALTAALVARQDFPLALQLLGELKLQQDQPRAAAEFFVRGFAKSQESAHLVGLGKARSQEGDAAGAEEAWKQAEELLTKDLERGHYGHGRDLAELYLERGRPGDVARAVEVIEAELKLRRDSTTLTIAARAYKAAGNPEKATEMVAEATRFGFHSEALEALSKD